MRFLLPLSLLYLLALEPLRSTALPNLSAVFSGLGLSSSLSSHSRRNTQGSPGPDLDRNPNGSAFIWIIEDIYAGQTFFEYVLLARLSRLG
jgi:hypothetical protein